MVVSSHFPVGRRSKRSTRAKRSVPLRPALRSGIATSVRLLQCKAFLLPDGATLAVNF